MVRWAEGVKPLLVPIDSVKQHPDNPNSGDDDNLVQSIQINGFVTAVTADAKTGYIIAGNTRYRALHALGATEIPVLWVDHWDGDGAVRYLVGDNASARKAVMDDAQLLALLGNLAETERGLVGTSVTDNEYERMLLEFANTQDAPDMSGFGGPGEKILGVFQIVLDFPDNETERDAVFADLAERYPNVRSVNL